MGEGDVAGCLIQIPLTCYSRHLERFAARPTPLLHSEGHSDAVVLRGQKPAGCRSVRRESSMGICDRWFLLLGRCHYLLVGGFLPGLVERRRRVAAAAAAWAWAVWAGWAGLERHAVDGLGVAERPASHCCDCYGYLG